MAVDIIARGMAAGAAGATATIIESFSQGFQFKGAVDYVSDLPASGNTSGDLYVVRYTGSSGTNPLNARYAWGKDGGSDAWILIEAGRPDPYTLVFNASEDWSASGSGYAITVAQTQHLHGADASAIVWRKNGTSYEIGTGTPTEGYNLVINSSGDMTISVEANGRFAGKLTVF